MIWQKRGAHAHGFQGLSRGVDALPASPETLAAYLAREPEDGRAASKSASALSGSNSSRSPQASAAVPREVARVGPARDRRPSPNSRPALDQIQLGHGVS